ncbi:flagellar basal-body MS-ring/collar protein FliF [Neptunomonas phycophila]|jgi:flagellar M-ring protein FliF|uniref:Flagellar M-ring protein n=2 Tax=Neptunomonas phycophila TaxID=1572645 RepID=A0AAW7XQC7_9GAMM|nr:MULTISPECIES: flagellar basal-body MS-ring/collar protein FliF [Neptunomonas]MBT3144366.1 flagellar M-ring protein FliF [Neptunomonas phycophila]MDN2660512.1 flagellar basal-body MS-ring/collar protein FliF [Neptunomonas sp. CHC150]MDO6455244.1 flagellar basal-body MS-ring/collar protein FliF [Neptunomonas phycophila]MDO6469763.1 flagellar basal-body MS-ring/collar protein FliF [Neptunomonas phycophila]MDO6785640.1 flagellar basal-body MS-ring/collar protein FliF [Neptunomonas phycophila]
MATDNSTVTIETSGGGLLAGFNKLSFLRQFGLMVGLAASIAIGLAVVLWSKAPDYRVLFSNLQYADANEVIDQLNLLSIPYKFEGDARTILVPEEYVYQARLRLASEGFTNDKTVGFELLDQEQSLGVSQFMESARFRRGLEGELARTITSVTAVRNARVHLAIPKESVFVRDQKQPSASIFVELYTGRKLDRAQVAAIANLVASSVPSLDVKNVTVVDQRGQLLNSRDEDVDVVLAGKQFEYSRKVEETLLNRVNSILMPVVGQGRYRAEVSADVDFTAVEQTDEIYNPDLPALRSEQTLEETRVGTAPAQGVPGALSNQPPGPTAVPEVANGAAGDGGAATVPGTAKNQATRNFELDRSISYTRHHTGRIGRLTVAVVVDDLTASDPETGELTRTPWSESELARLRILVQDAVGFSAVRGDSVNVINSPFVPEQPFEDIEIPIWKQQWVWDIARQVGAVLFVLLMVFGVLRPILKNLATTGAIIPTKKTDETDEVAAELEGLGGQDLSDDKVTFGGRGDGLLPTPSESFEFQLNAVRSMIAEDPARVAQAVKQWLNRDE